MRLRDFSSPGKTLGPSRGKYFRRRRFAYFRCHLLFLARKTYILWYIEGERGTEIRKNPSRDVPNNGHKNTYTKYKYRHVCVGENCESLQLIKFVQCKCFSGWRGFSCGGKAFRVKNERRMESRGSDTSNCSRFLMYYRHLLTMKQ